MSISKIIYKASANATPEVWMDATPATAAAEDIMAPKTAMLADGNLTTGTGSGEASNIITSTFTPTNAEKNTVKTIVLPYSGDGWPIIISIFPTGGYRNSPLAATGRYKTMINYFAVKDDMEAEPDYETWDNAGNYFFPVATYKYDSSAAWHRDGNPDSYSTSGYPEINVCYSTDPSPSWSMSCVKFTDATHMKVFIAGDPVDEDSYGFLAGTEYTYRVIYSVPLIQNMVKSLDDLNFWTAAYIGTNGTIQDDPDYRVSDFLSVDEGELYASYVPSGWTAIAYYDSNKQFIERYQTNAMSGNITIAPQTAAYLRVYFTYNSSNINSCVLLKVENKDISFDDTSYWTTGYFNNAGVITTNSSYKTTPLIEISGNTLVGISKDTSYYSGLIVFDSNMNVLYFTENSSDINGYINYLTGNDSTYYFRAYFHTSISDRIIFYEKYK